MKNVRKKLLESWALAAGLAAAVIAAILIGANPAIALVRTVLANIQDSVTLVLALQGFNIALLTTFGFFVLGRWFTISDSMSSSNERLQRLENTLQDVWDSVGQLKECAPSNELPTPLHDEFHIWRRLILSIWIFNPALKMEADIRLVGAGEYKIKLDQDRLETFFRRFTDRSFSMQFLLFVPARLVSGIHPVETLLKLIFIANECKRKALAAGLEFQCPRLFLRDAPRPWSSLFLSYRRLGDTLVRVVFEYFRGAAPHEDGTSTGEQTLFSLSSERKKLEAEQKYKNAVYSSAEIDFEVAMELVSKLLPSSQRATAKLFTPDDLQKLVDELYAYSRRTYYDVTVSDGGAHLSLETIGPSVHYRPELPRLRKEASSKQTDGKRIVGK